MTRESRGLGRGLEALLGAQSRPMAARVSTAASGSGGTLPLAAIQAGRRSRGGPSGSSRVGATPSQAVVVHFQYGSTDLSRLFELEKKLETATAAAKVGEYDGNEVAVDGSDGFLYMYGPDADRLFDAVKPVLDSATFMRGARVTVRYGAPGPDARQREVVIAP